MSYSGVGVYSSLSIGKDYFPPFGDVGQLLLGIRYRQNELVPLSDGSGSFDEVDRLIAAGRLRLGLQRFNFFGEGAFVSEDGDELNSDTYWKVSLGVDVSLVDNVWISVGLGGDLGRDQQEDTFVLANLKWAFQPEPQFRPLPQ